MFLAALLKGESTMNIYQTVTHRILEQLKGGQIPWRKTWSGGIPKSLTTGKEYRGINVLILGSACFTSRYWVTFLEAKRLGGHIRKGERSTPVFFWKWRDRDELQRVAEETGKENPPPFFQRTAAVFNLDQVEGLPRPSDDVSSQPHGRLDVADRVFEVMPNKPAIVHGVNCQPAYIPHMDRVELPHLSQFEGAEEYYAALFHELVHATGHPKRLNRFADLKGVSFNPYSFEELVAEFGAAFLCTFAGVDNPGTDALQASYIDGWAKALEHDNRLIVRAASAAQRAADYIRGKLPADFRHDASAGSPREAIAS
ncbi:MAG TPA: zincin-like metallopeptidase domain-containing protein [Candidatus Paceibacterota bacterium]|nr:zincin-like metallopeptidase domain-containing protein [Candidatus Paceibacterota bacterium]